MTASAQPTRPAATAAVRSSIVRPGPLPQGVHGRFHRGRERPRGIAWFGARAFWGHLRHFIASAIATEDVDSRDWMTADDPRALTERLSRLLGAKHAGASVAENLGRDLWVDYLADTGDDVSVSRAVAGLLFTPYELPDPDAPGAHLVAPRGDILFFGGDTAYPVATADEITNRVIAPFNQVLQDRTDGRRRVLLGIPGNHDWYDGLDGFCRMFRRHLDFGADGAARPTLHGTSRTMIGQATQWAREFVRGGQVEKPKTLDLIDYVAVQAASYFVLPVAPGVALFAVDRQLKHVDSRQQYYFGSFLNTNLAVTPWVILPDPVYAFGQPSPSGTAMIRSLGLTLGARPHFVLSGDIHHYRREREGPTLHVTAGGGGAFLHPAPLTRSASSRPAEVEWPNARQCRSMLWQVPLKVALGRSGILPHIAFALVFLPAILAGAHVTRETTSLVLLPIAIVVLVTIVYSLIGGVHRGHRMTVLPALGAAMLTAAIPLFAGRLVEATLSELGPTAQFWASCLGVLVVGVFVGAFIFGAYLAILTLLGYENTQAFTALDHPGFKHVVRLRVRADGSAVDGWCIGLVDPLAKDCEPVLVDTFTWRCR